MLEDSINSRMLIKNLDILFKQKDMFLINYRPVSLSQYIDENGFKRWKNRGYLLNVNDYLNQLNYRGLVSFGNTIEDLVNIIECIYNLWYLALQTITKSKETLPEYSRNGYFKIDENFYYMQVFLDNALSSCNLKACFDCENERVLIVEDSPQVTAVAELLDEDSGLDIIRYNHYSLRGNLEEKRKILARLGRELEPHQKELAKINGKLKSDIFNLLNNFHIRHSNEAKIEKLSNEELEELYDDLYQMILLGFLVLDNKERESRVKNFIAKIS